MKLSFEFADRLDFHFKTFIAIPHMFCVCLNCLKIPIIITEKLPLTYAWFYEKGFSKKGQKLQYNPAQKSKINRVPVNVNVPV